VYTHLPESNLFFAKHDDLVKVKLRFLLQKQDNGAMVYSIAATASWYP
jgi:hypothetical protein